MNFKEEAKRLALKFQALNECSNDFENVVIVGEIVAMLTDICDRYYEEQRNY